MKSNRMTVWHSRALRVEVCVPTAAHALVMSR